MRKRTCMFLALGTAVLLVTSCKKQQQQVQGVQEFPTTEVVTSNITIETTYSASIQGRQNIKIMPRVDGHIQDVRIVEGQKVKQGQSLFLIDNVPFVAAYDAAKAQVAMAEANVASAKLIFDSKKALYAKEIVSEFDMLTAKNAYLTAEASHKQAKAQENAAINNLTYTEVKSPTDGVVGKIPYREGDYVSPAMPQGLTTVADNSEMYVYFSMSEKDVLSLLSEYSNAQIAVDSMPAVKLKLSNGKFYSQLGKIESISGVIEQGTGAVSVRASFENTNGHLISGGAGVVLMPTVFEDVIVVPQEATYEIQNKTYVYKIVDGKATATIIDVEPLNDGKQFVVNNGLTIGDRIISSGVVSVREGMMIK